ncbi:MAG: hypothetical protein GY820_10225, partial [Gammaproteobacteria bacterium]|nr:hypothetical protein [Gammaproteobacteria bacterium]
IEDYLDMVDVNGAKLSRGEMLGVIENNTPKPKIVPVSKTQYKNYSLNARDSSMFENYDDPVFIVSEPNLIRAMEQDFMEKGDTFEYQLAETGEWHPMSGKDAFQSLDFSLGSVPDGRTGELVYRTRMTNANTGEVTEFPFVDDLHDYMWTRYSDVGIGISKTGKYDEHMLVVPGGTGARVADHFADEQALTLSPNDTMIGHARIEAAELDGQPGKMVLEIQSDYHTEGQRHGYIGNKGDSFVGSQPIAGSSKSAERKGLYGYQHVLVAAADKNNIDPFAKNAMSQVWPFLDEGT